MKIFIVKKQCELMAYLIDALSNLSRKEIKQYLSHGSVSVNEKVKTGYDHILKPGDTISIASEKESTCKRLLTKSFIQPVYEDNDIIVVDKPSGLLTIANETTYSETLYYKVTDYVRAAAGRKETRVFIVHRLDEDASGLIVFAKNVKAKCELQKHWDDVEKKYYAIVEGCPKEKSGEIKSYLVESDSFRVYSAAKDIKGKLAITQYKVIKTVPCYSLLEATLVTGRKNQIRVHFYEMGCPIIGDKKYGAKTNPVKRLGLHAYFLSFIHPIKKEKMTFRTKLPNKLKHFLNLSDSDKIL